MFIAHFNRYFEKHAKITYFVLLIVIIATFVIFVTPGDVFRGGERRVSDLGEMYGKKLKVEAMRTEFQKTTVAFWLQYPQFFGRDLGLNNDVLLQQTLARMRLLHAAKSLGLTKVSDEEVKSAIAKNEAFFVDGKFSPEGFKNTLDALTASLGLLPSEFDQVVRENIIIEHVRNKVTDAVSVTDEELRSALAQYSLKCATIPVDDLAGEPSEEDIQNFFVARRAEIQLPATKNALVAIFKYDDLKLKAATDAAFGAAVNPTQEEIQGYFNTNGARLFPGKELSEVSAEITETLRNEKVRAEARRRALELSKAFATSGTENAEERKASFQQAALTAGATLLQSGLVSTEDTINGLPGAQPRLAAEIRKAANMGDVTGMAIGTNYTAVAYITEKQETQMPAELPALAEGAAAKDYLRTTIREKILREKALNFFQEEVKAPYEGYAAKVKEIEADEKAPAAVKQQQIMLLEGSIDAALVSKFFVPEARDFVLATFAPEAYRDQVAELTEEELRKAYDERADYKKVRVRLGRIFLATDGLEGDALTAKEAKLAEIQQKLSEGGDFLALAKEYSEDTNTEDRSLRDLDSLAEAIRAAVANLQAGQVSAVVKDARGSYLVKVLERQDGRAFAEVQTELKEELTTAAAKHLADEAAANFALAVSDKWWAQAEKATAVAPAELFEETLKEYPAAKLASFTNVSEPDEGNYPIEVLYKVFTASEKSPITSNVVTNQASYVAALTGKAEAHLSDPTTDDRAYITLLAAYREAMQMQQALRTAQAERARLTAALVGDADFDAVAAPLKFEDLPAISQNDINSRAAVVNTIENGKLIAISDLGVQLPTAKAGMVLEPIRAERRFNPPQGTASYQQVVIPVGYQLIYVAGVNEDASNTVDASVRDALRDQMLATKKSQALNSYMEQLEIESNTRLREE